MLNPFRISEYFIFSCEINNNNYDEKSECLKIRLKKKVLECFRSNKSHTSGSPPNAGILYSIQGLTLIFTCKMLRAILYNIIKNQFHGGWRLTFCCGVPEYACILYIVYPSTTVFKRKNN